MQDIKQLIKKSLQGQASPGEKERVNRYMLHLLDRYAEGKAGEEERSIVEYWYESQKVRDHLPSSTELTDMEQRIWKRLTGNLMLPLHPRKDPARRQKSKLYRIAHSWTTYGVAASIALLLVVGLLISVNNTGFERKKQMAQVGIIYDSGVDEQVTTLVLPDGSKVFMNKETRFRLLPGRFNSTAREVELTEGEAFFEVAKDAARPFIVHTPDGLHTKVLGTSFNIKAYSGLAEQVISVLTGKVQVSKANGEYVRITPDRKAVFNKNSNTLAEAATDAGLTTEWMDGRLVFEEAGLDEIKIRMLQQYNVQVVVLNEAIPADTKLKAAFLPGEELKVIAQQIAEMYGVTFRIENKQLIFE